MYDYKCGAVHVVYKGVISDELKSESAILTVQWNQRKIIHFSNQKVKKSWEELKNV